MKVCPALNGSCELHPQSLLWGGGPAEMVEDGVLLRLGRLGSVVVRIYYLLCIQYYIQYTHIYYIIVYIILYIMVCMLYFIFGGILSPVFSQSPTWLGRGLGGGGALLPQPNRTAGGGFLKDSPWPGQITASPRPPSPGSSCWGTAGGWSWTARGRWPARRWPSSGRPWPGPKRRCSSRCGSKPASPGCVRVWVGGWVA